MKKRIIGFILVIAMLTLTLCSCAYSFEKDDMTKYAAFDFEGFKSALAALEVEDGDFTADETTRQKKVIVTINEKLADSIEKVDANRKKDGAFAADQLIYFCYFASFEKDGETIVFDVSNMKSSAARHFVGACADDNTLYKAVFAALKNQTLSGSDLYQTEASSTVSATAGRTVYVSYIREYQKSTEDGSSATVKETVTLDRVTLPETEDETFAGKLIGQKLASALSDKIEVTDAVLGKVTYSGVKIEFQVQAGKEYTAPYTFYAADSATGKTSVTDIFGKSHDIKGVEVTLHIFPQYVYVVKGLMSEAMTDEQKDALYTQILTSVLGKNISTTSVKCFTDSSYKYTNADNKEITLESVIKNVVDLKSAYDTANKEYTDAADADKEAKKTARDDAQKKLDAAVSALPGEVKKFNTEGKNMVQIFIDDYKTKIYDDLKSSYEKQIKDRLKVAVYNALKEKVQINSTPASAVTQAQERVYQNYKYKYYTGTVSSNSDVKIKDTFASVKAYIMDQYSVKTYEEAEAKMRAEAEKEVKDVVMVYAAAQKYPDITVSSDDVSNYLYNLWINLYINSSGKINMTSDQILKVYGEVNIRCKLTFDKLMDELLKTGTDGKYVNLNYTTKAK